MDIAQRMAFGVEAAGFGGLIAEPESSLPRAVAVHPSQREDYSDQVVLLGRLKAGKASESRRVVHVLPLVPGIQHNPVVTARCGAQLSAGDMQWLTGLTGMPCEQCVMAH